MNKTIAYNGLVFEPFTENDIEALSPIIKRAFDDDTKIHSFVTGKTEGGPPGYDDGGFFREWYLHKDVTSYKISQGEKLIGGIALWINENHINYLGNVFIDPDLQGKGIGKTVWDFAEHTYPETVKWQTDTPWYSRRNLYFYVNKCGFKIVEIRNINDVGEPCMCFMEKEMGAR